MTHTLTTTLSSGASVELTYVFWPAIPSSQFGPPEKAAPPLPAWAEVTAVRVLEPVDVFGVLADCEIEHLEILAVAAEQQAAEVGAA